MPQYDIPCDVLMLNRNDMERGTGRFHHQAVDHSNTDRTEPGFVSKAKPNMECPIPNHRSERPQNYPFRIRYAVVARQFADARAVDSNRRWQHMEVDRTQETVLAGPGRSFSLPSLSLGFTHTTPQV
jgi:hypothetical protein